MNILRNVFAFFIVLFVLAGSFSVLAQIRPSKNIQAVESVYLIADSAIIEYLVSGKSIPYKIYDFSTRYVYVYFGDNEAPVVVSFGEIGGPEISYIRQKGCSGIQPNDAFQRFCD